MQLRQEPVDLEHFMRHLGFSLDRDYIATIDTRRTRAGCNSIDNVDSVIRATTLHNRQSSLTASKSLIFGLTIVAVLAVSLAVWFTALR
jgi:hypothetical protein